MNLLNTEVENSSRYEFLILTKNWNTKKISFLIRSACSSFSWHVSAAVMFALAIGHTTHVTVFPRRTSLTHIVNQHVLCGKSGSHPTTSSKHDRRQHHRSTAGHMMCRSCFSLKSERSAGILHRRFEETCVASMFYRLNSQRACDRPPAEAE